MRSPRPKILTLLLGRPLINWTLEPILELDVFSEILIACSRADRDSVAQAVSGEAAAGAPLRLVVGGETRQESIANCLWKISGDCDVVAVHDGARPLLTSQMMLDVLNRANETGAAIAAVPCKDTVKVCNEEGVVSQTLDRSNLWLVQTPQCFNHGLLVSAHEQAKREQYLATDDAALVERTGAPVHVVTGSYENLKVTTPEDIAFCEEILKRRQL